MRLALALLASLFCTPAMAGVVLITEDEGQPKDSKVFLESDRARVTFDDGVMIYRADRKLMWVLDDSDKTYTEITPATAKQMNDALLGMRGQMDEMLKSMPPEQRRMMEQQMGQVGKPPAAPPASKQV